MDPEYFDFIKTIDKKSRFKLLGAFYRKFDQIESMLNEGLPVTVETGGYMITIFQIEDLIIVKKLLMEL